MHPFVLHPYLLVAEVLILALQVGLISRESISTASPRKWSMQQRTEGNLG